MKLTAEAVSPSHQNQDLKCASPTLFSPLLSPFCLFIWLLCFWPYHLWSFFTLPIFYVTLSLWVPLSLSLSHSLSLSLSLSLCSGGCRWRASILWCFPYSLSLSFPNVELSFSVHSLVPTHASRSLCLSLWSHSVGFWSQCIVVGDPSTDKHLWGYTWPGERACYSLNSITCTAPFTLIFNFQVFSISFFRLVFACCILTIIFSSSDSDFNCEIIHVAFIIIWW